MTPMPPEDTRDAEGGDLVQPWLTRMRGGQPVLTLQRASKADLELVGDHVPQALVVHKTNEDVGLELLSSDSADHGLPCSAHSTPLEHGTCQAALTVGFL